MVSHRWHLPLNLNHRPQAIGLGTGPRIRPSSECATAHRISFRCTIAEEFLFCGHFAFPQKVQPELKHYHTLRPAFPFRCLYCRSQLETAVVSLPFLRFGFAAVLSPMLCRLRLVRRGIIRAMGDGGCAGADGRNVGRGLWVTPHMDFCMEKKDSRVITRH